ncbi:hypothetical protein V8D89_001653 [Ganoderma adspersum]
MLKFSRLYGVTLAQTFRYARLYPSDLPLLKIFVAAIFSLGKCMVRRYFTAVAGTYYIPYSRILRTKNICWWYSWLQNSASRSYCLLGGTIVSFKGRTFETLDHFTWINAVVFGLAIVVDLILTGAFITIIRQSRTDILGTSPPLVVLARYAVFASAPGSLAAVSLDDDFEVTTVLGLRTHSTSALAIPAFVCSLVLPKTFVHLAIVSPGTKVYANSVVALLNCRSSLPRPGVVTANFDTGIIKISALLDRSTHQREVDGYGNARMVAVTVLSDVVLDISAGHRISEDSRQEVEPCNQV